MPCSPRGLCLVHRSRDRDSRMVYDGLAEDLLWRAGPAARVKIVGVRICVSVLPACCSLRLRRLALTHRRDGGGWERSMKVQ